MAHLDENAEAYYVGLMNASGYRNKDLKKPIIGVVNSWNDVNPGHKPLRELAQYVKEGIWAAGGAPAEFCVPAPCDGVAQLRGMQYILPARDLIAASIESMSGAHHFDGLVFLCACDKIVPAMLMAAASIDLPSIFLTPGSMLPYEENGQTFVTPDLKESIGGWRAGRIDEETFDRYRQNICFSCGTCSMYGTANTMAVFAEAIGLCPFGSATMPFCASAKYKQARDVGERIVELVQKGQNARRFMSREALENGIRHVSATGGSSNFALHIMAIAKAAEIPLTLREFDRIQEEVPLIARFKPSSRYNMLDYGRAGGALASLKAIEPLLHTEVPTVSGLTLGELLKRYPGSSDSEIIHPIDAPIQPEGCFSVLYGNLAPEGAVVKKSGVDPAMYVHRGPAVVFDSEEEVMDRYAESNGINPCQRNNGVEDRDEHDLHSSALKKKSAREEDQVDNHHDQDFAVQSAAEEALDNLSEIVGLKNPRKNAGSCNNQHNVGGHQHGLGKQLGQILQSDGAVDKDAQKEGINDRYNRRFGGGKDA